MTTIKMLISKVKLLIYPSCEVKCRLQNGVLIVASQNSESSKGHRERSTQYCCNHSANLYEAIEKYSLQQLLVKTFKWNSLSHK